jgi:hypothetical protein
MAYQLNLVERWFAELTTKKLRRGTHTSVRQLNTDIRTWIHTWNDNPRNCVWTKTADQILESIGTTANELTTHDTSSASTSVSPMPPARHFAHWGMSSGPSFILPKLDGRSSMLCVSL